MGDTEPGSRPYTLDEGARIVKTARHAIELHLTTRTFDRQILETRLSGLQGRHGVFVTLSHAHTHALRGCIGMIKSDLGIARTLVDAAIAAATEDPRFVPVSHRELEHVVIEVSILTRPEKISGTQAEIKKSIRVGRDGLLIEYGYTSGLLLPIVAVEEKWDSEEFLQNVCIKAGLDPQAWKQKGVSLYRFSTQVFRETEPNGQIEEVDLA